MFPKALLALLLSSIYSQLLPFPEPPSLCRRHLTLLFLSPNLLRLKHYLLQNALQQSSFWMTANLSTLNSSKLNSCSSNSKSNYTKYITPRCTQPIPLASLTSSLMNTSPLQTKFHHSLNHVIIIFINSAVFALTSIPQQPPPLPPPILHRSLGT